MCTQPFGRPVLPEEYSSRQGVSTSSGSASRMGSAEAIASAHHMSRPERMGTSIPSRPTTRMRSIVATPAAASSAMALSWIGRPRLGKASHVTSSLAPDCARRSRIGSGPYPLNIGTVMAPIFAAASIVTIASGTMGSSSATTSPRPTPHARNTPARRSIRSLSSAYVSSAWAPSSPSHQTASDSPRPASTHRSTEQSAQLSRPPLKKCGNATPSDRSSTCW